MDNKNTGDCLSFVDVPSSLVVIIDIIRKKEVSVVEGRSSCDASQKIKQSKCQSS